jgi:DNA-binding response OmpR family regulator
MSKNSVYIIDDTLYNRIIFKEYLSGEHYHFVEMENGKGITSMLDSNLANIILLDWQMPIYNGLSTLKEIRSHSKFDHIPIVIITGFTDNSELENILSFQNVDFLRKPVNKIELITRVKTAIKLSHCLQNQAAVEL